MLIRYEFSNGEVSVIEVSDELGETLADLDRQEHNNDQTQTRRHVLMSVAVDEQGMQFHDESIDVEAIMLAIDESERLQKAMEHLMPDQRVLIHKVYMERRSVASIARDMQISERAVHYRLSCIYKKLCKVLS